VDVVGREKLPSLSESATWDERIRAVGPASLLVLIEHRTSPTLKRLMTSEDILQDALLLAWRDRNRFEWRGLKAFRSWLLSIIDHRIQDASTAATAAKRGGGRLPIRLSELDAAGFESGDGLRGAPVQSTTPSQIALYKEQADAMRAALDALPADLAAVVRLRLFEQRSLEETADALGIGISAAWHRFRKGAEAYRRRLRAAMTSRSRSLATETARKASPDSAPE
jgi:RNA polymerase sigma factor (sigma-70 family)